MLQADASFSFIKSIIIINIINIIIVIIITTTINRAVNPLHNAGHKTSFSGKKKNTQKRCCFNCNI